MFFPTRNRSACIFARMVALLFFLGISWICAASAQASSRALVTWYAAVKCSELDDLWKPLMEMEETASAALLLPPDWKHLFPANFLQELRCQRPLEIAWGIADDGKYLVVVRTGTAATALLDADELSAQLRSRMAPTPGAVAKRLIATVPIDVSLPALPEVNAETPLVGTIFPAGLAVSLKRAVRDERNREYVFSDHRCQAFRCFLARQMNRGKLAAKPGPMQVAAEKRCPLGGTFTAEKNGTTWTISCSHRPPENPPPLKTDYPREVFLAGVGDFLASLPDLTFEWKPSRKSLSFMVPGNPPIPPAMKGYDVPSGSGYLGMSLVWSPIATETFRIPARCPMMTFLSLSPTVLSNLLSRLFPFLRESGDTPFESTGWNPGIMLLFGPGFQMPGWRGAKEVDAAVGFRDPDGQAGRALGRFLRKAGKTEQQELEGVDVDCLL